MSMPKVLQINTCLTQSTGRIAQQIGEKAIDEGWESYIAYPARVQETESKSSLIKIGTRLDQYFHALLSRLFDCCGFLSFRATNQLISTIRAIQPDIIHLHNIHGYYLNIPLLFDFFKKAGIPVVWTLHDCWGFTGHCVHYTSANCYKWRTGCYSCPRKKSYPASLLLDRSRHNYELKKRAYSNIRNLTIVPVSFWLGEVVNQSILNKYPIKVIQNGIDINTFSPREERVKDIKQKYNIKGKFIILGVATGWSEEVGLSTFIRLRKELPADYSIVMVGCTPEIRNRLPDGIICIERTNDTEELAAIYTASDVLFNGSYQETFGLVTAEAMACGTPVIVYNSTACPEIVNNERGRIIPVGDFRRLIKAIESMRNLTHDERKQMSKACVEYVRSNLNKDNKYQEYIQLYKSLI